MSNSQVFEKLQSVFRVVFDREDFCLELDQQLGVTEDWDSFLQVNLVIGIEGAFGIEFSSAEIGELTSVIKILTFLESRVSN
jgi:acyl carrier protein